jgi:hypothetical protein
MVTDLTKDSSSMMTDRRGWFDEATGGIEADQCTTVTGTIGARTYQVELPKSNMHNQDPQITQIDLYNLCNLW